MRDWFDSLQTREQRLVIVGAIVVTLTLFWMLIWNPLTVRTELAHEDVERKRSLLENGRRVIGNGSTATAASGTTNAACRQSLTLLIANTVRDANLRDAYRSSTPFGSGGLRVSLENASFDDTVRWLGRLHNECNVSIESGAFTKRPAVGRVDVNLALERGS